MTVAIASWSENLHACLNCTFSDSQTAMPKIGIHRDRVVQVALLRQGKASGRLVVLVQALTTPTLVAAAAADSQPAGSFVQGIDVPAVIQVTLCACCLASNV